MRKIDITHLSTLFYKLMTKNFPVELLQPLHGLLSKSVMREGSFELTLNFTQFSIEIENQGCEDFDGIITADGLLLPSIDGTKLQNNCFKFPTNPDIGYIDASVYFDSSYNPVDISALEFGPFLNGSLQTKVTSRWIMSYESPIFQDFDYDFTIPIRL